MKLKKTAITSSYRALVLGSLLLAGAFTVLTPKAEAAARFSLLWAPTYSMPTGFTGGFGVAGGGLTIALGGQKVGFETGALYTTKMMGGSGTGWIDIPVGVRLWLGKVFTVFAGGFAGIKMSGTNLNSLNYGFLGKLGVGIPVGKSAAIVIEGGYQLGLADVSTAAGSQSLSGVVGGIGVRFGGGN
jgi:hypothetical protein